MTHPKDQAAMEKWSNARATWNFSGKKYFTSRASQQDLRSYSYVTIFEYGVVVMGGLGAGHKKAQWHLGEWEGESISEVAEVDVTNVTMGCRKSSCI